MVQERPITPEKQLLKLIEAKPDEASAGFKTSAVRRKGLSLLSAGAWLGRISFFKAKYKKRFRAAQPFYFDIKVFNRVLLGAVSMLLIYFVIEVSASVIALRDMPILDYQQQETLKVIPQETTDLLRYESSYLNRIRKRDIFKMGMAPATEKKHITGDGIKSDTSTIKDATAHLKLVGISWSDSPDVLIEDTKALRTFFVKRGQTINNIKVEAVFKDKVVLSYGGEEIELK